MVLLLWPIISERNTNYEISRFLIMGRIKKIMNYSLIRSIINGYWFTGQASRLNGGKPSPGAREHARPGPGWLVPWATRLQARGLSYEPLTISNRLIHESIHKYWVFKAVQCSHEIPLFKTVKCQFVEILYFHTFQISIYQTSWNAPFPTCSMFKLWYFEKEYVCEGCGISLYCLYLK